MTTTSQNLGPSQALQMTSFVQRHLVESGIKPEELTLSVADVVSLGKGISSTTYLVRSSKRYIVPFARKFYSYPLMLIQHPTSQDLFKMQAPIPNILREGLVIVDSEAYFVKIEDLRRGIVRKSRKLPIPLKRTITYKDFIDGLACTPAAQLPSDHPYSTASLARRRAALEASASNSPGDDSTATSTRQSDDTPRAEGTVDLDEELRLADLAFQEQIGSVFSYEDPEEEWEDPDNT